MSRASDADASSRPDGEITQLLEACSNGEPEALDRLMPLVYDDLRAIAHRRLALERADHTLNTTAVVHEAYLKLVDQATATWRDRAHFFAVSARVIRNLLVDYARERKAAKRGGNAVLLPLDEQLAGRPPRTVELLALQRAKTRVEEGADKLEASDPRTTTYAEGGVIKEHVRGALDLMTQAGHWALISAAYHRSSRHATRSKAR